MVRAPNAYKCDCTQHSDDAYMQNGWFLTTDRVYSKSLCFTDVPFWFSLLNEEHNSLHSQLKSDRQTLRAQLIINKSYISQNKLS